MEAVLGSFWGPIKMYLNFFYVLSGFIGNI